MLPTEDDPEGEEHGVEDALPDVSKKQHPGPVEANREPLYRDVDKRHGDTESKNHPDGDEHRLEGIFHHHYKQVRVVTFYSVWSICDINKNTELLF